jgi:hypothetical protein
VDERAQRRTFVCPKNDGGATIDEDNSVVETLLFRGIREGAMISKYLATAAAALALALAATQANAIAITPGAGWLETNIVASGAGGAVPFTFTVGTSGFLSVVDCCQTGDQWTVSGDLAAVSSLAPLPTNFPLGLGTIGAETGSNYDSLWTNASFQRLQTSFGPGSYSINVSGNGAGGLPAHFGIRVDAVPGPIVGAGLPGLVAACGGLLALVRRRRQRLA